MHHLSTHAKIAFTGVSGSASLLKSKEESNNPGEEGMLRSTTCQVRRQVPAVKGWIGGTMVFQLLVPSVVQMRNQLKWMYWAAHEDEPGLRKEENAMGGKEWTYELTYLVY